MTHYLVTTLIVLAAGTMAFVRVFAQGARPRLQRQAVRRRIR
jgi:hypothetical protein